MPHLLNNILVGVSGISWFAVYVIAAIRGYLDKTYVIPLPAIIANISWEELYGTVFANSSPCGRVVPLVWLALDLPLLCQVFLYWRKDFRFIETPGFLIIVLGGFIVSVGLIYYAEASGIHYLRYAFPQNLMMSIMFVQMLFRRKTLDGQSIYVGFLKMIGTGSVIICSAFPLTRLSGIDSILFIGIVYFDLLYILMLHKKAKQQTINLWKRV